MKHFLRISRLSLLLAGPLFFTTTSCQKKDEPAPAVSTVGTVDGSLTPVGSIDNVVLSSPGSTGGFLTYPDVQGYFKFDNVQAGTYNVSFTTKTGYDAPNPRTITVVADKTTSMGTIAVAATPPPASSTQALRGTLTWQTDGVSHTGAVASGSITAANGLFGDLAITGVFQNGSDVEKIELFVPTYRAPSIYNLDYATNASYATFLRTSGGVPNGGLYTTKFSGVQGTVTVTAHNTSARTITGTFGYTSFFTNAGYTYRTTISSGTFSLSY